jgi:hypothetical protein
MAVTVAPPTTDNTVEKNGRASRLGKVTLMGPKEYPQQNVIRP